MRYLKTDIGLECYSSEHKNIIYSFIIPIALIWTIGFPALTFLILYKKKNELDDRSNVITFGLFYIGLKDETFYWEVVVNNLRKLIVVAMSVIFGQSQAHLQLMLIFSYLYFNH